MNQKITKWINCHLCNALIDQLYAVWLNGKRYCPEAKNDCLKVMIEHPYSYCLYCHKDFGYFPHKVFKNNNRAIGYCSIECLRAWQRDKILKTN